MIYKINWIEQTTRDILNITRRKKLPKIGEILTVVDRGKRIKVKVLGITDGGYPGDWDPAFDVKVEVLSKS